MSAPALAVIGMACRFPASHDLNAFWSLLVAGGDAIHDIPADRWNLDALRLAHGGATLPKLALRGGWLDRVRDFDPTFFRVSPREARVMDPKQRLALEVAHEALQDAGLAPAATPDRVGGCFMGTAQSEYLQRFFWRMEIGGEDADRFVGGGNDPSFVCGRISARFGLSGPSVNVNTACSTSLVAVHQAARAIQSGECDWALAGGVAIIESPEHSLTMNNFGLLSADSRCAAFDASGKGYVRAEGCGVVVLKRLDLAQADGDRIYAVVRGTAVNHIGRTDNVVVPTSESQARLLRSALAVGEVAPQTVDYVEAHGTGTTVGDPIEFHALREVFGEGRTTPLTIGSLKTNVGHMEVAAGIGSFIKTALCLHHRQHVAHLHLSSPNPGLQPTMPHRFPRALEPWPQTTGPRRAAVNSFGLAGTNAAAILEEAPAPRDLPVAARDHEIFTLSAYGEAPLRAMAAALASRIGTTPLATLARATRRRAEAHPIRAAIVASDEAEARQALLALASGEPHANVRRGEVLGPAPRLGWLFTGQGAQYGGMGESLYANNATFRATVDEADAWLAPRLGLHLPALLWGPERDRVHDTRFTQPALFVFEVAVARALLALGLQPAALLGHSIGEIAAAVLAGAISFHDGLTVVEARGALMGALPAGGAMAAVFASADDVREVLRAHPAVDLASDNAPTSTVVSGPSDAVAAVVAAFAARGVDARPLTVSHAFHSACMDPALPAFREVVAAASWTQPRLPLVSNLTGDLASDRLTEPDYWVDHLRNAVRFREGVETLARTGVTLLVEVGPDATLTGLARRTLSAGFPAVAMARREQGYAAWLSGLAELWCAGASIAWDAYDAGAPAAWADLPKYPYERRELWVEDPGPAGVVEVLRQRGLLASDATTHAPPRAPEAADTDRPQAWRARWDAVATPEGGSLRPGRIVIGSDAGGWLAEAVRRWRAEGRQVDVVDDTTKPATAWRDALSAPGEVAAVVLPIPEGPACDDDPTAAARDAGVRAVAAIAAHAGCAPDATFWLVTRGAVSVRDGSSCDPVGAGIQALLRVAVLEHPNTRWLRLDLDPAAAPDLQAIAAQLASPPLDEDQLATRGGRTYALRLTPQPVDPAAFSVRRDGSWLVTGGTGGLGLAIARDLLDAGVGRVLLAARSTPDDATRAAIAALEGPGRRAAFVPLDVADAAAVSALVSRMRAEGTPLRGVVHGAGVLADAPILKLDEARIQRVLPAKITGAWNLHQATRSEDLDAFVLMSSVTALLGAPAQGNYAIANGALDALAAHRHASGLPALSVAWGPWAEVGMAAHLADLMASRGMGALRPIDALPGLRGMIADGRPYLAFMDLQLTTLAQAHPGVRRAPLFRRQFPLRALATPPSPPAPEPRPAAAPPDLTAALPDIVATEVARLLGVAVADVDRKRPLSWQGLDSVMAVDLQRALMDRLQVRLPLDRLTVGPSVDEIASTAQGLGAAPPRASTPAVAVAAPVPRVAEPPPAGSARSIEDTVAHAVARLLGVDAGSVDRKRPLSWQGLDSVMAVDLQRALQRDLGVSLPLDRLTVGPAVLEIARLATERGATAAPAAASATPAPLAAAPTAAVRSAEDLVADEVGRLLGVEPASLDRKRPLSWQGLDSVMAVDLQRALERTTGTRLALDRLTVGPSVAEIATMLPAPAAPTATPPARSEPPAPASQAAAPAADVEVWLRSTLSTLLGLPAAEIDRTRPLAWQGFDSVMAVDLQRAIERGQGLRIPLDRLVTGPRPDEVMAWIRAEQGASRSPGTVASTAPQPAEDAAPDAARTAPAGEAPAGPRGNPVAWMLVGLGLVLGISWYVARTFAAIDPPARAAAQERAPTDPEAAPAPRKGRPKIDKAGRAEPAPAEPAP